MPETADDYVRKLRASGTLHEGFILTQEQREQALKSFSEGEVKIKKNTIPGLPYSVIKNQEGVPFVLLGFTKEVPQGGQNVIKIAQDLTTGEFCLVKIARVTDLHKQKFKKDEAQGETEALKRTPGIFKGYQTRNNPSESHEYKHYNFIKILPGIPLADMKLSSETSLVQCEIALKILEALQKLHKSGLIHRDFHKNNILIDTDRMELYIVDLGLAVIADKNGYWFGPSVADYMGTGPTVRHASGADTFEVWNRSFFSDTKIQKIITDLKDRGVAKTTKEGYPSEYNVVDLQPAIDSLRKYYISLQEDNPKPSTGMCSVS